MKDDVIEVDVHKIITTSFNVELNTFISYFEPKRNSFETVLTGGVTQIRINRVGDDLFSYYAVTLKNFRDDLFWKSVNWKFPLYSFISELDFLVDFYAAILRGTYTQAYSKKESEILDSKLINPLKNFFLDLDEKFQTDHFYQKIKNLKRTYVERMFTMQMTLSDEKKRLLGYKEVKIYNSTSSKKPVAILLTSNTGYVEVELTEGSYSVEIEKYALRSEVDLNRDLKLHFVKPSFQLNIEVKNHKNNPKRNVEIQIISNEDYEQFKPMTLKTNKDGYVATKIPLGKYLVKVDKYNLFKHIELKETGNLSFTIPKKRHWWQ